MREEVGFGERVVSLPRLLPLRAPRQQGVQRRKHKSPTLAGVRLLVRVYELLLLAGCCAVLLPPLALLRRDASPGWLSSSARHAIRCLMRPSGCHTTWAVYMIPTGKCL